MAGKADRFCSCTPGRFTGMVSSPCPPLFYSTQAPWTVPPSARTHPRRHSGEARGSGQLRASPPVPHCRIKGRVEGHTTLKARWNKSRICHIRAWGPRASHFIWSSLDFFSHLTTGIVIPPEEDGLEEENNHHRTPQEVLCTSREHHNTCMQDIFQ